MFTFLLVLEAVVAAVLVTVILMQRSEGGGLGVGGSSSGLMTARGHADFLTRATAFLAIAFVGLSILLAGLATGERTTTTIDPTLARPTAPGPLGAPPATPAEQPAGGGDFLGTLTGEPADAPAAAPRPTQRQQQTPAPAPVANEPAPSAPAPTTVTPDLPAPAATTPPPAPEPSGNEQ